MALEKDSERYKAEIPAHELWLHKSPQALKDVQEGLQQSKEGKVRKKGSFAKYTQLELQ